MSADRSGRARPANGWEDRLLVLANRITDRDRRICRLLFEHRVLTTHQIADVGFTTMRKAQDRLVTLNRLEVVDRFRPHRWSGSAPAHHLLGPAGAAIVAAERNTTVRELGWRRDVGAALVSNSHLTHLVGCNGFFTGLIRTARLRVDAELVEWLSERQCAALWGEVVLPDGYGVWIEGGRRLPFLLEFDLGTETLSRLQEKLAGYALLARAAGYPTWVLFVVPTRGRESAARAVLSHPTVPVATAVVPAGTSPDGGHWLPVGDRGPRRRLVELAAGAAGSPNSGRGGA